ncbi:MAG: YibE/F family protein [Lachnospirales bacterium]
MNSNFARVVTYIGTILFSIVFLYFGNNIANSEYTLLQGEGVDKTYPAKVMEVIESIPYDYGNDMGGTYTYFKAKLTDTGEEVTAKQTVDDYDAVPYKIVEKGDKVLLGVSNDGNYEFSEYIRSGYLILLGALFVFLLLLFGRSKGFNTLISLVFTCLAVFAVFVPAVISGQNIYIWTVVICVYIIIMTLLVVNGPSKKSLVAVVGCSGGVCVAGTLTVLMNLVLGLSGVLDESTFSLTTVNPEHPIDLLAIIFASITIGSMGAVMDVAVDISASLHEIKLKVPGIKPKELFKSGMTIGRDLMGTMANTLVLAYIGSALATTLLLVVFNGSLLELFNKERVIVEVMQALIGSIGIILTLPFTSFIAGIFYKNIKKEKTVYDLCEEAAEEFDNKSKGDN